MRLRSMRRRQAKHSADPDQEALDVCATTGGRRRSIERGENILARDALRGGHLAEDGIKSADAQRLVVRNREAVMLRGLRLQDDVATDLVDLTVSPPGAQDPRQITAV